MTDQQKSLALGALAVVVVVGGFFVWQKYSLNLEEPAPIKISDVKPDTWQPSIVETIPVPSEKTTTPTVKTAPPTIAVKSVTTPLNYTQALNLYRGAGAYFQLVKCNGNPGMISLKKGVKFMVDNRDRVTHRIGLGKSVFTIKPYGFLILTASYPGTSPLTCDGGGAAQLNVEG